MTQFPINAQAAELTSQYKTVRHTKLEDQGWTRKKSEDLAIEEGIDLNDQHWQVIMYLRRQYIEDGLPRFARTVSRGLNKQFSALGGSKYLYGLFSGGPVTQGSRIANIPSPAGSVDLSFGTSY